jgi:hypothetical protein
MEYHDRFLMLDPHVEFPDFLLNGVFGDMIDASIFLTFKRGHSMPNLCDRIMVLVDRENMTRVQIQRQEITPEISADDALDNCWRVKFAPNIVMFSGSGNTA